MSTTLEKSPASAGRDQGGRFAPGRSGNPAGKPKGTRNRASLAAEELLAGEAEALTRKAVELALEGDTVALRLCLERVVPVRKGRPVNLEFDALNDVRDVVAASRRVVEAVGVGELTPDEAQAVGRVIETTRRAIETEELERRIADLEAKADGR